MLPWRDVAAETRLPFPPWIMLILCPLLSLLAIVWHGPWSLPVLAAVEGVLLVLARPGKKMLLRLALAAFWQTAVITGLYVLRYDMSQWQGGMDISFRLILVFVPGMLTVRLVPPSSLERILGRILPGNLAFVASCCLRFFPLLLDRIRIIHEAQVLRGARVMPRELLSPRNWPDAVICIGFPAIVQSIELATEIADSAKARGFEMHARRTLWPQDLNRQPAKPVTPTEAKQ
ncbi:energy-coupling factor transporter transmembrane component T family protein [Pseudodesulfovibrio cashew]|uniref:energy-coupling factor transporter transmembrane component T family protein n=1 Tax=Pseudodesulfovibrio cashew TaxID=2678688 RepID=UPI00131AC6C4|nr:energy-coupling factor transporter transmembrane component T [Pseudodesulfovibrio cashew]